MLDKINKRRNWCCLQYKNIWVQLSWYTGEFKRAHPCWCWWCWTKGDNWCCGMLANLLGYYFLYLKEWSTFHFYFYFLNLNFSCLFLAAAFWVWVCTVPFHFLYAHFHRYQLTESYRIAFYFQQSTSKLFFFWISCSLINNSSSQLLCLHTK